MLLCTQDTQAIDTYPRPGWQAYASRVGEGWVGACLGMNVFASRFQQLGLDCLSDAETHSQRWDMKMGKLKSHLGASLLIPFLQFTAPTSLYTSPPGQAVETEISIRGISSQGCCVCEGSAQVGKCRQGWSSLSFGVLLGPHLVRLQDKVSIISQYGE